MRYESDARISAYSKKVDEDTSNRRERGKKLLEENLNSASQWIFMPSCPSHRIIDTMNYFEWRYTSALFNTEATWSNTLTLILSSTHITAITFRISSKSKWILPEIVYRHIIHILIHICAYIRFLLNACHDFEIDSRPAKLDTFSLAYRIIFRFVCPIWWHMFFFSLSMWECLLCCSCSTVYIIFVFNLFLFHFVFRISTIWNWCVCSFCWMLFLSLLFSMFITNTHTHTTWCQRIEIDFCTTLWIQ